jgi:hypothetical protein
MGGSKLDSIPADQLVCVARNWFIKEEYAYLTLNVIKKMIHSAEMRGNDEAKWLLPNLYDENWSMSGNDPKNYYYKGMQIVYYGVSMEIIEHGTRLIVKSAKQGFAPAIAWASYGDDGIVPDTSNCDWLKYEAEDRDDNDECFKLMELAAKGGNVDAMYFIDSYNARYVLLTCSLDIQYYKAPSYTNGRELDGYDEFWDPGTHPHESWFPSIRLYREVTNRARRAALQTVVVLRFCLGRDVARMIGMMVYRSRSEDH